MTTYRTFMDSRETRVKDLFGAVLILLTALLYWGDLAPAEAQSPTASDSVAVVTSR